MSLELIDPSCCHLVGKATRYWTSNTFLFAPHYDSMPNLADQDSHSVKYVWVKLVCVPIEWELGSYWILAIFVPFPWAGNVLFLALTAQEILVLDFLSQNCIRTGWHFFCCWRVQWNYFTRLQQLHHSERRKAMWLAPAFTVPVAQQKSS